MGQETQSWLVVRDNQDQEFVKTFDERGKVDLMNQVRSGMEENIDHDGVRGFTRKIETRTERG